MIQNEKVFQSSFNWFKGSQLLIPDFNDIIFIENIKCVINYQKTNEFQTQNKTSNKP